MNIHKATTLYEAWLAPHIRLLPADLELKHKAMAANPFSFFRATFYRWMQLWPAACPECLNAPQILGVGDLHVENFGTWRDIEGRLVWGINDFDEAYEMPYTVDLVRLAASAHLAIRESHLAIDRKDACDAILAGYMAGLAAGGRPFVLAETHIWLRTLVSGVLRDPAPFWAKLDGLPAVRTVPPNARKGLERMLPAKGLRYSVHHRVAGLGSLGRERYVAIAQYDGGQIAREAKALAPSGCVFADRGGSRRLHYQKILDRSVRCPDPFVKLKGSWIVRRLAPDCSRVELASMPRERDESKLLHAMGFETANVHLGTPKAAAAIRRDLKKRPAHWLHTASAAMAKALDKDWHVYRGPDTI
jgi:hypothetical protein